MMKWISVNDRLPKCNEKVLAFYDGEQEFMYYTYTEFLDSKRPIIYSWQSYECLDVESDKVTHWMPLPKGPEDENK